VVAANLLKGVLLMQLKKIAVAVVLGLGIASAHAEVKELEWLSGNVGIASGLYTSVFEDVVTFSLASDITGTATLNELKFDVFGFSDLSLALYSGTYSAGSPLGAALWSNAAVPGGSGNLAVTFNAPFVAGNYFFVINGTPSGALGGAYNLNVTTAAVPEPSETAMLLAGMGLIGLVARRRVKKI
jgi:hypothetical protein